MECPWDAVLEDGDAQLLPPELLQLIQDRTSDPRLYLEGITKAALDARYTYRLLAHCEDVLAHICASLRPHGSFASSVATLARIVPHATYLTPYAARLLERERHSFGSSEEQNVLYLLGLFRLLRSDHRLFRRFVRPQELASLLGRSSRAVTYLTIRILQIYLEAADHWFESTIKRYLGQDRPDGALNGRWDEKTIDYRFLSLWEEERFEQVLKLRLEVKEAISKSTAVGRRTIPFQCFHPSTALLGDILFPRAHSSQSTHRDEPGVVVTDTISSNLESIARALRSPSPILLTGLAGSGKSLLIRHAARNLGHLDKMVTLHLNEQSDAKLLIGIYTSGDTPGSFIWKPGVLTTAVQEGRWVLIEDLDRTPNEVLGTLLPLIEKRELFIPNRNETIYASEGFRILATVRSSVNHRGEETKPLTHMLGHRHWQNVAITMPSDVEHAAVAQSLFPSLEKLLPQFMAVYERLLAARQRFALLGQSKTGVARSVSPRDLLKWCQRVSLLLKSHSSFTSSDKDHIFLEAIDCFVGSLPDDSARSGLAAAIAEELQIDPQRRDWLLYQREVPYKAEDSRIVIGRHVLPKTKQLRSSQTSFSTNPHTNRMLERVSAAVLNQEPLLLVGETGVGKTTAVQHLAAHLGKKLVPFNLSQQSEAGDLLGGFKPVNARTLVVPMKDEFDELFAESFSATKNKQFIELLGRQMSKGNWKSVCKLWRQALIMVDQQRSESPPREGEAPSKKRKVESRKTIDFARWDNFAGNVKNIERKLADRNDAVAFTFVEGNIVKAVRNGDWILLDEINLAAPDTLESIADLLDHTSPSILLTEAGNIERIEAHPEFRVFAAMNPATDVGKKDLPPGIRSRFTELYVEGPDRDLKSLEAIVSSYLGKESISADPAVARDVSVLHQKIIGLSEENKLVDGAGQKPHFSLRTLTRTLSYAKRIQATCGLRRALFEGFQMSFLTFLDSESAQLVQPTIKQHLLGKIKGMEAELKRPLRKPNEGKAYVEPYPGCKHWIRQGVQKLQDQDHYIITPFVRSNLENLVRASSTRQFPVLIQGPTSSGKTSMIEYLAKRTGHTFTRINNHEHTDLQEYLGTYISGADGRIQFQEGVLVKALREGHWIVLDELNLAPTDVLEALNRLLDDNRELRIPETQEVVRPHSDFMLFATQNPAGLYGGRKTLSRAFRNRFLELHFDDIPVNELQEILHRRTQLPESRAKRIVNVYKELSVLRQETRLFEQKSFATLRDLFRWALRQNDTIEQLAANGYMLLCERVRKPQERTALKTVIENVMSKNGPRVRIDEDSLYADECPEVLEHKRNAGRQDVVWTKAMRRLYVLVSRAILNNEPVLLVGETGCGKTTVCQMLADALRKELHTVNAHQNTETGDLIGSHRPVRDRAATDSTLRQLLLTSPLLQTYDRAHLRSTDDLLAAHDEILASIPIEEREAYSQTPTYAKIQVLRGRLRQIFEWSDGTLVKAMRSGDLFLLDEISLADDSVLERLNSVLESQRTILLAEKGSLDSSVTAADGFQFLATMNPGGDYGKRELSPALRNRFTEIWVPSLSDLEDVLQIVRAKLVDSALPHAQAMVGFADWFKKRFDNSASSSVSIRDTLAWVDFINVFARFDVLPAVVHGAAMVYIDTLGANPAGLISLTSQSIDEERHACLVELGRLLAVNALEIYGRTFEVRKDDGAFGIGPFSLPRTRNASATYESFTFDPPTTRSNAMRVLRALQLSKPLLLEGSPGVGKTALVTAVAAAVNMPLTRINLSDQTDLLDLFGSDAPVEGAQTGTFVWRDAPFLRAMKNGEWVLLDEMNLASQSVLEGLNACLDHRGEVFIPELGQSFARHPDFRLFAAQNPHHQGGGRKGLPASFVNRFTVVYADSFRFEDLMLICQRMFPTLDRKYLEQAVNFVTELHDAVADRREFGSNGGPWEFNLRDIARWLELASSDEGLVKAGTPRDFVETLFTQRFRTQHDRDCLRKLFDHVFIGAAPVADLFCNLSPNSLQVGLGLLRRDQFSAAPQPAHRDLNFFGPSHLQVLQSAMLSVQRRWPVILAGPPGVGKTRLVERLAASVGANVATLAMSAETDALDLIGGYEQHDPHRQISRVLSELRARCDSLVKSGLLEGPEARACLLLRAFQELESSPNDKALLDEVAACLPPSALSEWSPLLETLQGGTTTIDKARFEWVDGPLVEALQQGKWLVIDNANLCSASVLDRLNSLLEPNGALIINEHSTEDGSPRILRPHPSFRIFLTVDPRLGELSRAMRNRAVELHMTATSAQAASSTDGLYAESAMANFKALKAVKDFQDKELLEVTRDHFALADQSLVSRLQQQISNGLFERTADFADASEALNTRTEARLPLGLFYQGITSHMQVPADYACVQTLHPLNNQPLVQQSQRSFAEALSLSARYDLTLAFTSIAKTLAACKDDRKMSDRLGRFWKTARKELNAGSNRNNDGLLATIEAMLQYLWSWLHQADSLDVDEVVNAKATLNGLLSYAWVLLQAIQSEAFDLASLAAFNLAGQSMSTIALKNAPASVSSAIGQYYSVLCSLSPQAAGTTGSGFTGLWKAIRPTVPSTIDGLQALLRFEAVVDRFDQAVSSMRLPVAQIVDLKLAFQQALSVSTATGRDMVVLAEKALGLIPGKPAEDETTVMPGVSKPHFADSFELLCRHFAVLMLASPCLLPTEAVSLEMFAQRKTVSGMTFQRDGNTRAISSQFRLLELNGQARDDVQKDEQIGLSVLQRLLNVDQAALRDMSLLDAETRILGQTLSSKAHLVRTDELPVLKSSLRQFLQTVLETLASSGSSGDVVQGAAMLLQAFHEGSDDLIALSSISRQHRSVFEHLASVISYLVGESNNAEDASTAWASFALGSLELYVPSQGFDPVQEAHIERQVYQHTRSDLESRLNALRAFREAWFGDQSSLRARLLLEDIRALGDGPATVEICRPHISQLAQLHGEFQALMRILRPLRTINNVDVQALDANAWSNLRVIRTRLQEQYRAYADLAMPVVGFIDCLFVSRRLAILASSSAASTTVDSSAANLTPLVGAGAVEWLSDEVFIQAREACRSKDEQLHWLAIVAVRSTLVPVSKFSPELQHTVENSFRGFYDAWKVELSRDQKLAAANSSLYKYRGGDIDQDEVVQTELDELFPDYSTGADTAEHSTRSGADAQALAPKLACLYHSLFSPDVSQPEQLLGLVRHWAELAAIRPAQVKEYNALPALMLGLENMSSTLTGLNSPRESHNIYKDANIGQSRALIALVEKVQMRFESIHDAWPEHATPIEVLRACAQILDLGHAEPVARYLPPVEKLHGTINEWQKVASSEYSAATLLEDTTNLIVGWRQLELSTWAGMFDSEDEQCKENAASWWYIAYETIIQAAGSASQDQDSVQNFAQQLLQTLSGFLANCGLGEYRIRLGMLVDFKLALASMCPDQPSFGVVHDALSSVISFYSRFEGAIADTLAKKRAELEKDIKNVIQLASWKDRNIETLKNGAKASHKKLFKTVRKYRKALGEPVEPLLRAEFPYVLYELQRPESNMQPTIVESAGMDLPVTRITVWRDRPSQFINVDATVKDMVSRATTATGLTGATKKIEKFLKELEEESEELRRETPNTATEEKKTLVQHLKTRKRRLLADVFRDVRNMGFSSNLGEDVKTQQRSLQGVLARSPPLTLDGDMSGASAADQEFHRLLQTMEAVRSSDLKPSDDLTPAEVDRAKNLLESMLRTMIDQRNALKFPLKSLAALKALLDKLSAFGACQGPHPRVETVRGPHLLQAGIASLGTVLRATLKCVDAQGTLSKKDYTPAVQPLQQDVVELEAIKEGMSASAPLPDDIESETTDALRHRFNTAVESIGAHVRDTVQSHPELGPVLSQLLLWQNFGASKADRTSGPGKNSTPVNTWLHGLFEILEKARALPLSTSHPTTNGHSKQQWLIDHQTATRRTLEELRIESCASGLNSLMAQMAGLQVDETATMSQLAAICHHLQPILYAYLAIVENAVFNMIELHSTTSKMAHKLATAFVQLARHGFCQPSEKAESDEQQSGQVESGTGLGDGEGGEDISKDVGNDEDLSELAQDAASKDKEGETEAEKDAVDMADEDLEGKFNEDAGSEGDDQDDGDEGQSDAEIDEEAGHVDGEKDDAVDEKTWNDQEKAEEAEKEADGAQGTKSDDVSASADNAKEGTEEQSQEGEDEVEGGSEMDNEAEHNEPEQADAHLQEVQNLDLPEDMEMDGPKKEVEDISDGGDDLPDEMSDVDAGDAASDKEESRDVEMNEGEDEDQAEENGEAAELEQEGQDAPNEEEDAQSDIAMLDKPEPQEQPHDGLHSGEEGQGQQDQNDANTNGALPTAEQADNENDAEQPDEQSGTAEGGNRTHQNRPSGQAQGAEEDEKKQPLKQLGDVLKQWYDQHRNIEDAQEAEGPEPEPESDQPMDVDDARFEHTDDAEAEMQALGAAKAEQSRALNDENAVPLEQEEQDTSEPLRDQLKEHSEPVDEDETEAGAGAKDKGADSGAQSSQAVVGQPTEVDMDLEDDANEEEEPSEVDDVDEQLTNTHLSQANLEALPMELARQEWSDHESRTRNMAIVLTEHLRLILQPTQATKMRGDFRTGKRLNIKKIIPYIASSYKRDKIWMRRSIPSKRSYQILLAIDDSESMNESERKGLAFDTLALVAKSMSMLEVGELAIVGFGESVHVAHDFSMPFTSDAGAQVVRHFRFSQSKTDVRALLERSIELFRAARLKAASSTSNLWQLQLIISDGLCQNHAAIRRLVRQAHEERIMVVFIIVDATAAAPPGTHSVVDPETTTKQSIVDLQTAEFQDGQVRMQKYLDTFPFRYYLIVRDVQELPNVLAGALRQWFAEVVESG
ncbi:related to midasin (AAA ATPase) [Lecanosticta acicola]|uniref:Midasin n=1 Tax=Lecanosticta acicola TaxID=111012 RepID=A0AAI8Z0P5_9PEZI|nr:related to midasin (AAA ATPase) [Lecanosticta acicola]